MKSFFAILAVIAFVGVIIFGINAVGFMSFSFWAPKYEGVRRDVMIQSRAYSEASTRELYRLKVQYQHATSLEEKSTIRAFAIHESQGMDRTRLPDDLKAFVAELEAN